MFTNEYVLSSPAGEAALPEVSENSASPRQHKRLRLYLVGSPADTQQTIHYLQAGGRIEHLLWSHVIRISENGILIRPDPGDVLRYLQRERLFS